MCAGTNTRSIYIQSEREISQKLQEKHKIHSRGSFSWEKWFLWGILFRKWGLVSFGGTFLKSLKINVYFYRSGTDNGSIIQAISIFLFVI